MQHHPTGQSLSATAGRVVKAVAITGLGVLVAGSFYVSYESLHTFAFMFGKDGYRAMVVAVSVDLLTLLGLLVALTYPSMSARSAFITGLLATGVANILIGYWAAGWFGAAVGVFPVIALELSYRTVLSLLFPNLKVMDPNREGSPSPSNPNPETSKPLQEEAGELPEASKDLQEITPKFSTASEIANDLSNGGWTSMSRAEVVRRYGVSEWTARQALRQIHTNDSIAN